jgi:BTB/POZ domain
MSSSDEVLEILDDPNADVILCSCDHHKFRVLKLFVTRVSPVLHELIQSASTSHVANPTSPLPSAQLSDSGTILSSLLTFILPMLPVLPSTPGHTMILLSTAQKYQMDSILSRIRGMIALQNPPFIRRETAFQVYNLARMHGLHQEALQAARTALTFPFTFDDLENELEAIHCIYLHELWKYYQSVQTHLEFDLEAFRATGMPALTCPPCGSESTSIYGTPIWLDDYVSSIAESPALFDLTEFYACFSRHIIQRRCSCSIPNKAVRGFWTDLMNVVHSCMTKVSLDARWLTRL